MCLYSPTMGETGYHTKNIVMPLLPMTGSHKTLYYPSPMFNTSIAWSIEIMMACETAF